MSLKEKLKAIFIRKDTEICNEFKVFTVEEYEQMSIKELLDLRYSKNVPTEELHKILKVLEKKYPLGICHCRPWGA